MTHTITPAALTDTHRAVLRYLVDAESVSEYTPRVEAGNRGLEGTAPYPTLRAMERRGLVAMHRRVQAAVGAPAVSYWTAELTDAGRDALAAWDAEQADADVSQPPVIFTMAGGPASVADGADLHCTNCGNLPHAAGFEMAERDGAYVAGEQPEDWTEHLTYTCAGCGAYGALGRTDATEVRLAGWADPNGGGHLAQPVVSGAYVVPAEHTLAAHAYGTDRPARVVGADPVHDTPGVVVVAWSRNTVRAEYVAELRRVPKGVPTPQ